MSHLKYDVIYILNPNASVEDAAAVSTKVEQIVADAKGTVLKKDDWGKRRLAYLVQKHRDGHYVFYHLSIDTQTIAEISRNLRLMEQVIKFSVVKDTISHLKAKVKPVRVKTSTEGTQSRPGSVRPMNRHNSAPVNPSPVSAPVAAPVVAAPAPEAAPVAAEPTTTTTTQA
jgi:small subunit ribosomal protein S6